MVFSSKKTAVRTIFRQQFLLFTFIAIPKIIQDYQSNFLPVSIS